MTAPRVLLRSLLYRCAALSLYSKRMQVGVILLTQQYSLAHAQGALNLSQGCPDFDALDALQDAVQRHMYTGLTQYTHHAGCANMLKCRRWISMCCADSVLNVHPC